MPPSTAYIPPEVVYDSTLTEEQKRPVRICSVYPSKAYITHGSKIYNVPAFEPGMRVAMSDPVGPGDERRDFGNDQRMVLQCIPARDNAMDAIGLTRARITSRGESIPERSTSEWWESGYFVPRGPEPTDEEIAAAHERLRKWAMTWLGKGDEAFSVDQKPGRVDFRAKLAARILKVRRAWSEGITEATAPATIPCPSCRLPIVHGATKCPACGDRFVYIDGKPVYEGALAPAPAAPSVPAGPPPGKAQVR